MTLAMHDTPSGVQLQIHLARPNPVRAGSIADPNVVVTVVDDYASVPTTGMARAGGPDRGRCGPIALTGRLHKPMRVAPSGTAGVDRMGARRFLGWADAEDRDLGVLPRQVGQAGDRWAATPREKAPPHSAAGARGSRDCARLSTRSWSCGQPGAGVQRRGREGEAGRKVGLTPCRLSRSGDASVRGVRRVAGQGDTVRVCSSDLPCTFLPSR